jgi:hypothetical protein
MADETGQAAGWQAWRNGMKCRTVAVVMPQGIRG